MQTEEQRKRKLEDNEDRGKILFIPEEQTTSKVISQKFSKIHFNETKKNKKI